VAVTSATQAPLLSLTGVVKQFPGQLALDHVNLELLSGEILALMGQNGSGKSTLIKVLAGFHQPDSFTHASIAGQPLQLGSATEASKAGIRFVHQTLGLVESMNAVENCALLRGFPTGPLWYINWAQERERVGNLLHEFGVDINPRTPVGQLRQAQRTLVAVVRALQDWEEDVKILVLDEPTASLPIEDVNRIFEVMREIASRGIGIIFVSHRLDEVFDVSQRLLVLRDGRNVMDAATATVNHDQLVEVMIGRTLDTWTESPVPPGSEAVLEVSNLAGRDLIDLSFTLHKGEILGFAGLIGSGRDEINELLFGAQPCTQGEIRIGDQVITEPSPPTSLQKGIAYAPADRMRYGINATFTIRENLVLPDLDPLMRRGFLSRKAEREQVAYWGEQLDIKPRNGEAEAFKLSGGNQQKVVLAKLLRLQPDVLLLDEPTQGVDIGAKASLYKILADRVSEGLGVVVCSGDSEELAHLCDRVLVISEGRMVKELSGASLTPEAIETAVISAKEGMAHVQ
jgi:ribose transport system ATP-binding protein